MARGALLLAALSGVLSYAACYVAGWGTSWGAGIVFGLLVLAPTRRDVPGFLGLLALSIAVYRAAVWLAVRLAADTPVPDFVACGLAGVLGAAVLSLGTAAFVGAGVARRALALAMVWGLAGGLLIGWAVVAPDESPAQKILLLAGFVVWQVGYTAAHRLAPWRAAPVVA